MEGFLLMYKNQLPANGLKKRSGSLLSAILQLRYIVPQHWKLYHYGAELY